MLEAAMATFFEEASENLDVMEQSLLKIELYKDTNYAEEVNAIFRAVHTIKGSAGMFGFDAVVSFTHVLENLLDNLRNLGITLNTELTTILFASRDHIEKLLASCTSGDTPPELMDRSNELANKIENNCLALSATNFPQSVNTMTSEPLVVPNPYWHISLKMPQNSFIDGIDPLPLIAYLGTLGKLINVEVVIESFPEVADFDAESCYFGFEISLDSTLSMDEILSAFEFIDSAQTYIIIEPHSEVDKYLELLTLRSESRDALIRSWWKYDAIWKHELSANTDKNEYEFSDESARNAIPDKAGYEKDLGGYKNTSLRVDSEKLDTLINLIGELVTTGAGVALMSQAFPDMSESVSNLNGLVEEIRDSALRLRMVPVAGTFNRFNRLVRDTAKTLGKQVTLTMSGEDTELDKSVIEQIADPLVHLVRNAIDHGIEMPNERIAKGKSANGSLQLSAYHASGSIVLKISDDGKGLHPELIKKRAIEKGLINPEHNLSNEELFQLIFEPGFSTKETVTDLSGRGVGMDVVRRNINDLRGRIEIESEVDQGTTISIFMPLTLAIIDGFLVSVGNERFVLPLDTVEECVALDEADLKHGTKGSYMALRDQILPLLNLRDLFNLNGEVSRRRSVIVVLTNNHRYGLIVDRLLGESQTVIKPLGDLFKKLSGVSGSTIMADGNVALILDLDGLTSHLP